METFVNTNKAGPGRFLPKLQLYWMLWLKPEGRYQRLRGITVICVISTFLMMNWHTARQQAQHEIDTLQRLEHALMNTGEQAAPAPFADWATQTRKFGQDERANITSLKVSWNEQAQINTKVQLARDRKRAPKGCNLINPIQAECSTSRLNP